MEQEVFDKMLEFSISSGYLNNRDDNFYEWEDLSGDGDTRIALPSNSPDVVDDNGQRYIPYQEANGYTGILQNFNAYNENAAGNTKDAKIELLNSWLRSNGYNEIPPYNTNKGSINRDKYLHGLRPEDYPGVILPE